MKYLKVILIVGLINILGACSYKHVLTHIPSDDADFRLSPKDLLKKYPEIEKPNSPTKITDYAFVEKQMGKPDETRKMPNRLIHSAAIGGMFAMLGTSNPYALGASWMLGTYMVAPESSIYQWNRGDYEITAQINKSMLNKGILDSWQWKHKSGEVLTKLKKRPKYSFVAKYQAVKGLYSLDVGRKFRGSFVDIFGFGLSINSDSFSTRLTTPILGVDRPNDETPLYLHGRMYELTQIYEAKSKLKYGIGLNYYHTKGENRRGIQPLDDNAIGYTMYLEYELSKWLRYGLRYEHLNIRARYFGAEKDLNLDNVSIYMLFH